MEEGFMAVALAYEVKARAVRSDDWEHDIGRLQRQADIYERRQAIKARAAQIVRFFFRHARPALRAVQA